jgi:hypothetical protein
MSADLRSSLVAAVVALACVAVVTARAALAPSPPPRRSATEAERAEIAALVARSERGWMEEATQNFPQDHWSQRDDFHGRELGQVLKIANEKGVRVEDVLRAIDDDIHRARAHGPDAPDHRNARAIPCKPRPFYD